MPERRVSGAEIVNSDPDRLVPEQLQLMSRRIKVIEQLALSDLNDKSGWADLGIAEGTKYVADETFRSEVPSRNIDSDCDVSQLGMVRPLHKLVNYMIHDPVIE